jgi:hypothetical protein
VYDFHSVPRESLAIGAASLGNSPDIRFRESTDVLTQWAWTTALVRGEVFRRSPSLAYVCGVRRATARYHRHNHAPELLGGLEGLVFRAPAILEQSPRTCAPPFHSVPIGDSQPPRTADVTSSVKERRPGLERLGLHRKLQELSLGVRLSSLVELSHQTMIQVAGWSRSKVPMCSLTRGRRVDWIIFLHSGMTPSSSSAVS